MGIEDTLLISATSISFSQAFPLAESFGGVALPEHVDKSTTSVISNLGFIPPDSTFKSFEMKNISRLEEFRNGFPYLQSCKSVTNSDAHYLQDINEPVNFLHAEEKSAAAVIEALRHPSILQE